MEIKGDFLSFKFDGHDISEFGAVRTSDGDRFKENLQPEIKDISAEVPGMNGEYYFGSTFGKQTLSVSFAFDSMIEKQFREMRRVFACGQISELVFSERPYKKYLAKIENPMELSYICFEEPYRTIGSEREGVRMVNDREYTRYVTDPNTGDSVVEHYTARGRELVRPYEYDRSNMQRVYKGEGTVDFVCYFPFAKSCYKTLPLVTSAQTDPYSYTYDPYVASIEKWKEASGILSETVYNNAHIDSQIPHPTGTAGVTHSHVYNPGDVETGFRLYCPFGTYNSELSIVYFINTADSSGTENWQEQARLTFKPITKLDNAEDGFLIDTNTGLVTGVTNYVSSIDNPSYTTDGILYNQFVKSGQFFKIKPTELGRTNEALIAIVNGSEGTRIFYDYLYF